MGNSTTGGEQPPTAGLVGTGWKPSSEGHETTHGHDHGPAPTPPSASSGDAVRGVVRGFNERSEYGAADRNWTVWSFRVDRYDADGNQLQSVPVVMRGRSFDGFLAEGHNVRVVARRRAGQVVQARKLYNETTDSWVRARSFTPGRPALYAVAFGIFALFVVGALVVFDRVAGDFPAGGPLDVLDRVAPDLPGARAGGSGGAFDPSFDDGQFGTRPDDDETGDAPQPQPVEIVDCVPAGADAAQASDDEFQVAPVAVDPGASVTWVNNGIKDHDVLFEDSAVESVTVAAAGGSAEVVFDVAPGQYAYACGADVGNFFGTIVVNG